MKNGFHKYDINRTRPRQGHKYSQYKNVSVCIKEHLSNFGAKLWEKLSNTLAELKKSVAYVEKACIWV